MIYWYLQIKTRKSNDGNAISVEKQSLNWKFNQVVTLKLKVKPNSGFVDNFKWMYNDEKA